MADVIEFDAQKVRKYLIRAIEGFINDPPDSDYQCGFIDAICVIYREALGIEGDARVDLCDRMTRDPKAFQFSDE